LLEAAVGKFSADGLSTLKRAEEGAAASYAAGAMPLSELLAVRRELTAANLEFAELQRALALARVDLRASLGNW
jgi:outer membrane protein TolC